MIQKGLIMPELPEVETVKNQLILSLLGNTVLNTYQSNYQLRKPIDDLNHLLGQKFEKIDRKNKYILLTTQDFYMVIHLGMTGQLLFKNEDFQDKHLHMKLALHDGYLVYKDPRRFGLIKVYPRSNGIEGIDLFSKLGFEPLEPEFTKYEFFKMVQNSKKPLKTFLMDASYVCGIGNIYACEILFESGLHPESITQNITRQQSDLMHENIIKILQKSIALGGSSISDFVHTNGQSGKMQENYFVYGRYGQLCKKCKKKIEKITQGGRTSFFCSICQKKM